MKKYISQEVTERQRLYERHEDLSHAALKLMMKKNHDYATEEDPMSNFREDGLAGMVARLGDKVSRVRQFAKTGVLLVDDEKIQDTLKDVINYAVLLDFAIDIGIE